MKGTSRALAALTIVTSASFAFAQSTTVVKPHFMVMVDTSGSMVNNALSNTCGFTPANRLTSAKCVLGRLINGTGDAIFGLGRFAQTCSGTGNCTVSTAVCDATSGSGQILERSVDDNQASLTRWVDNAGTGCTGACTGPELQSFNGFGTPIAGSTRTIKQYYLNNLAGFTSPITTDRAAAAPRVDGCRPYRAIMLTDGGESCSTAADAVAATCELRRVCTGGSQNVAPTCDAAGNVTAGSCTGVTTSSGASFYEVKTYVIGFGIGAGDPAIENLAHAGGSIDAAGNQGFYASNEAELSSAFSQIIQDSLLVEVCNGVDDNCNAMVDEGFTKYCDRNNRLGGGIVNTPTLCTMVPDDCDGIDDNCVAGITDEPRNACGTCGAVPAEVCDGIDNDCDGFIDQTAAGVSVCGGCVTQPEQCNGKDDDCDGRVDEGVSIACGSTIAPCTLGMRTCNELAACPAGAPGCTRAATGTFGPCSGNMGGAETCNGVDDDCDGVIDGMTQSCGTDTGECARGVEECIGGTYMNCTAIGPQPEVCNGLDDNCVNGVDEGDPGGGGSCTDPGICGVGTIHCVGGALVCQGAMSAMPEICNNADDDCNGIVDDGIADMGPCGMPIGGACMPGVRQCVNGSFQCVGYQGPTTEVCNCIDDDCDGPVDEPPASGSLCPSGSSCVDCQCALPCGPGEFPCPAGKRCSNGFCLGDPCAGISCPNDANGTKKVCAMGQCVTACSVASCTSPFVCRPTDGQCVPDNCHYFPERCTTGQLCFGGQCTSDPCAGVSCSGGQFCRGGTCIASCATAGCSAGQECKNGACVATGCAQDCGFGRICNASNGQCTNDRCTAVICDLGQACEPTTGTCIADPCTGVACPGGQVCQLGDCFRPDQLGSPDGGISQRPSTKILATGGGGCACDLGGRSRGSGPGAALLALLACAGLVVARRKR